MEWPTALSRNGDFHPLDLEPSSSSSIKAHGRRPPYPFSFSVPRSRACNLTVLSAEMNAAGVHRHRHEEADDGASWGITAGFIIGIAVVVVLVTLGARWFRRWKTRRGLLRRPEMPATSRSSSLVGSTRC